MKTYKLLITILFWLLSLPAAAITFTHITEEDGLPYTTVYNVMQDHKGFIWFSTEKGVCRYDGRNFELFTTADGLADNEIFRCYEDSRKRIWFLSHNGKLSYYLNGRIYNAANQHWLAHKGNNCSLLEIQEDADGHIWITTSSKDILQIADTSVSLAIPDRSYHHDILVCHALFRKGKYVYKCSIDSSGNLLLVNLLNKQQYRAGNYNHLKTVDYRSIGRSTSAICIPSYKGILSIEEHKASFLLSDDIGIHSNILSCLPVHNGLWIGTAGEGLLHISNRSITRYLTNDIITKILCDREGNLWISTLGNGVYLGKNNYVGSEVLSDDAAFSIAVYGSTNQQCVVAGLGNGSIRLINEKTNSIIPIAPHKYNRILEIFPLSAHSILACSDKGVYEYHVGKKTKTSLAVFSYKNGEERNGCYWLCTPRTIVKMKDTRSTIADNNLNTDRYTAVAPVSDTTYYIGTTTQLLKKSGNRRTVILPDSVLKASIKDLKIINNELWIATHGNGLFILNNDSITGRFNTLNSEIAGNFCVRIFDDSKKFIWVATDHGITLFDRNTKRPYHNISGSQLIASDDVRDMVTDSQYAYIATAKGVSRIELNKMFFSVPPPQVFITSFRKNTETTTDPGSQVVFDYFSGVVNIGFTTATFIEPSKVLYEYKMANEQQWHKTQVAELPFFELEPGTYKLLFRAKQYNSAWGIPTVFTMVVRPTFFQSLPFKVMLLISIAGFIYIIVVYRIGQVRKREQEKNDTQKKMIELESKTLSCQMNPHFIFNSLNTVQQFILVKEEEQGLNYLSEFATLMRQILENSKRTSISLNEELAFLERYLQLEQIRYNYKFHYQIEIESTLDTEDIRIPPVMFQPLLENAIKHGISSFKNGFVKLKLCRSNTYLTGMVEDNGQGIYTRQNKSIRQEAGHQSNGLKIISERLKLIKSEKGHYGYMTIMDKSQLAEKGTLITINIPI